MAQAIRALVALADGVAAEAVAPALALKGDLQVLAYVQALSSNGSLPQEATADLVLVACSARSESATSLVAEAVQQHSGRPVVVLQMDAAEPNGFMQQVFAAGADDIIVLPETPERIRHALQKALARKRGTTLATGAVPAQLICLLGPKGGTGKTVVACNLAVALAEQGHRPILVDLDLRFGDVGLGLRLAPERTVYDLARSGGTLDVEKLDGYMATHASGVRALLAPTRPEQAGAISSEFIAELLAVARAASDAVIVDTSSGFPPEVITVIDSSTNVCVVGMLDAFSLKDTKLGLETLDLMGYPRDAVRLVFNRADSHVGIGMDDVKSILGREPDVLVPSQREIPRSITEGVPIVTSWPGSAAAKAFKGLAELYLQAPVREPKGEPGRRVSLLRRS
jgi:pilus assembly protein CpaE